ncbi:MAG: NAD(P)H-dependent oxidoreductase [Burkholderiales bacterium]
MNLYSLLGQRADKPIRVLLIGAGKFGAMFLSQARRLPGLHIVAIVDLLPEKAREALARVGWEREQFAARDLADALARGTTFISDDALTIIASEQIEVVIEATGVVGAGVRHALACIECGKHVVMVNVEADALAGPVLACRAKEAGVIYSLANGDQPALICELVDWARCSGFEVIAAGKGTKYLPQYHGSTPDTVWNYYGFDHEVVTKGNFNARMFNSFLDGTKSGIEMVAVANATGLTPAPDGLSFPPCGVDDLPRVLKPSSEGGTLHHAGQVEVVSSLQRNGAQVARDLRWGVYVVFRAESDYVRRCFHEYGLVTDDRGEYSALYRPYHLIGLELTISVASVALRGEPTGAPNAFRADVVAVAKRDLKTGDMLDGEGGYTVWGKLMPAADSIAQHCLPIGLAHDANMVKPVAKDALVRYDDVELKESAALKLRREMEHLFG